MNLEVRTAVKQIESDSLNNSVEINAYLLSSTETDSTFKVDDCFVIRRRIPWADRNTFILDVFTHLNIPSSKCTYLLVDCYHEIESSLDTTDPVQFRVTLTEDASCSISYPGPAGHIVLGKLSKLEFAAMWGFSPNILIDMFDITSGKTAILQVIVGVKK